MRPLAGIEPWTSRITRLSRQLLKLVNYKLYTAADISSNFDSMTYSPGRGLPRKLYKIKAFKQQFSVSNQG